MEEKETEYQRELKEEAFLPSKKFLDNPDTKLTHSSDLHTYIAFLNSSQQLFMNNDPL